MLSQSNVQADRPSRRVSHTWDCIVIGYNDVAIDSVERSKMETRNHSGAYHNFKTNTVPFRGRRQPLMSVLNKSIGDARGIDPDYSVAKLPNLGACCLVSYLKRNGVRAELVNYFNADQERLSAYLSEGVTAVAITTTFYVEPKPIQEIVEWVRRQCERAKIIVGGPYVFNVCTHLDIEAQDYLLNQIGADMYVFDSQGEATLLALIRALSGGVDVNSIDNIIYKGSGGGLLRGRRQPENNDMSGNVVDWDLVGRTLCVPTVQMRTARSCAFKCSFCRYPLMAGDLSLTSVAKVEQELRQICDCGSRIVVFIDDTFNVPLPRFKDICRMMIRNKFDVSWYSYFRCSNADDETFELMARSGCRGVFLGIESADPLVLRHMNKSATPERYKYGIGRLKGAGITTFVSLIVGFPGETAESVRRTTEFVEETAPTFYRAELYYHDLNTPIHGESQALDIRSAGYSWAHSSMNWSEACDHIDSIYRAVTKSHVLPLYMFDFWSIPYLVGQGISEERLQALVRIAQRMLLEGLASESPDVGRQEAELVELFR